MSNAYKKILDSLNEIITDLEETGGENLKRETFLLKFQRLKK